MRRSFEQKQQFNYPEIGNYGEQNQEHIQNEQTLKQQYNCSFCKRIAIKPISLICNHNLCLTCANFLKEQESGSGIQVRFRISCPSCEVKTVTYNVNNLIVQSGSLKKNPNSLQILSQQASPSSKKNQRKQQTVSKNQLSSSHLNYSQMIKPTNILESYHPSYMKQLQNQSWNSQENMNNPQNTINQTIGYSQSGQIDKSLEYSTLENRTNSLEATFCNQKNTNASLVSLSSISALNSNSNKNNSNIIQNKPSLFFTPNQNKQSSTNIIQKYIITQPTTQNYTNSSINYNCLTIEQNLTDTTSNIIQKNKQTNITRNQLENHSQQYNYNVEEQLRCNNHKEQYSLFCATDKNLLCVECLYSTKHHKTHNIIPLKNAQLLLKKENEEFKNQQDVYLKKLETSLQIVMQNQNSLSIEYCKNSQKIHETFDNIIETVNTKRSKLLEQLEQYYELHLKEVNFQISELTDIKGILEEYKNFDQKVIENQQSESYIFSAFKMIKQQLEQTNIDIKPLKNSFSIMQIDNNHKVLFNKLTDKIIQLSNQKIDYVNQAKHTQQNQGNSFSNQKQPSNTNNSFTQKQQSLAQASSKNRKDITPKKEYNQSLQNSNGKTQNINIPMGQTSQKVIQKNSNKKSTISSSEQVQKRMSTQACQKTSYKNLKRKLSTDFNTRNNSKENIYHPYLQYAQPYQIDKNKLQNEKKRSYSIQGEFSYNPNILLINNINTEEYLNMDTTDVNTVYENIIMNENKQHINKQNIQNVYNITKNTANNNSNRSPFKEYIIN